MKRRKLIQEINSQIYPMMLNNNKGEDRDGDTDNNNNTRSDDLWYSKIKPFIGLYILLTISTSITDGDL